MGQSSGTTQSTTTQQLTPEQQQLVSMSMGGYNQFANQPAPALPTGNQAVAPFTAPQVSGQQQVLDAANAAGPMARMIGGGGNTLNSINAGSLLDVGNNPVVQNAVKATTDPIFQNLAEKTIPQLQANAGVGPAGPNVNTGGSREGVAEGQAVQGAQRAAQSAAANVVAPAYSQGLQSTLQALGLTPNYAGTYALPGAVTEQVGSEQQQQAQNVLNANNQAAMFASMWPAIQAQMMEAGAAGMPGGTVSSTGQTTQQAAPWQIAAGLGAGVGGLLGGGGTGGGGGGLTGLLNFLRPAAPAAVG